MKFIIVNNSDDAFSYDGATAASQASTEVDMDNWFSVFKDLNFLSDLRKNNVWVNDGLRDYYLGEAEDYLKSLVSLNLPNRDPRGSSVVTTQYEFNDKDLKLARMKATISEGSSATASIKIPGDFLTGAGRYVAGGYAFSEDYDKDDFVLCWVEDTDRGIAMMMALFMDPEATEPLPDEAVQGAGVIPGLGIAMPDYPMIKSYNDEELPEENRGWYFWPVALGSDLPPIGECEIEPIAGYGHIPSGLYLKIEYVRKEGLTSGSIRVDVFWGKKD